MEIKIDKAFCITLDKRPEKWERFQKAYSQTGLTWELEKFSAIDGSLFTDDFILNSNYRNKKNNLIKSKGMYGCSLSHSKVHEIAKERGYKYIAVFEDDCWFKDFNSIKENVEICMSELPDKWKIFMLGGKGYQKNKNISMYDNYSENLLIAKQIFETHAYIANVEQSSDILIDIWKNQGYDADSGMVYDQKRGGYYLANPILCSQMPGFSDIIQKDAAYHGRKNYKKINKIKIDNIEETDKLF